MIMEPRFDKARYGRLSFERGVQGCSEAGGGAFDLLADERLRELLVLGCDGGVVFGELAVD